jgi:hypothetical protein
MFGTYIFDGPVNQHAYLDMPQNWFVPQLENLDIKDNLYFPRNGVPAH